MNANAPVIDTVAETLWRQANRLMLAVESGCTVDELRQRILHLAAVANILRGFPPEVETRPLMGAMLDTIPAEWLSLLAEQRPGAERHEQPDASDPGDAGVYEPGDGAASAHEPDALGEPQNGWTQDALTTGHGRARAPPVL